MFGFGCTKHLLNLQHALLQTAQPKRIAPPIGLRQFDMLSTVETKADAMAEQQAFKAAHALAVERRLEVERRLAQGHQGREAVPVEHIWQR